MRATRLKGCALGVAVVLALGLMASPSAATPVQLTGTNFDLLTPADLGVLLTDPLGVQSPMIGCSDSLNPCTQGSHGTLTTWVYQKGSLYTYKLELSATVDEVKRFSGIGEGIQGFNPFTPDFMKAGWSFSNALAQSGGFGTAADFALMWDPEARNLSWELGEEHVLSHILGTPDGFWGGTPTSPALMTFFLQSTNAPGSGTYSMVNAVGAATVNVAPAAPVSEPSSLLLLASSGGLASLGLWRGRRK